jgi:hypothetical protein
MPPIETKNSDILKSKKKISPADQLKQSIHDFLKEVGQISDDVIEKLIQEVPHKWERHGDLIIVPQRSLKDDSWKLYGIEFWRQNVLLVSPSPAIFVLNVAIYLFLYQRKRFTKGSVKLLKLKE